MFWVMHSANLSQNKSFLKIFLHQQKYELMFFIPFREGDWDGLRRELSQKGGNGKNLRE